MSDPDNGVKAPFISSSERSPYIISNESGKIKSKNKACHLILTLEKLIVINPKSNVITREVNIAAVIGAKVSSVSNKTVLDIYIYDYPEPGCCACCRSFCCFGGSSVSKLRDRSKIILDFSGEEAESQRWEKALMQLISGSSVSIEDALESSFLLPLRRYLVFVNPMSGQGTAKRVWDNTVKGMFEEAGLDVTLIVTTHANNAREYVHTMEINSYDVIVVIGGDGILYEVVNGIASRPDGYHALLSIPVFPIPGGTGNGLAKSLLFECGEDYSVVNAAFVAIRGSPVPLDLSVVQTKTETQHSFLILGWGLISDIDILSETMRCLGESRLYVAAIYYTMLRRLYRGRLSIYTGAIEDGGTGDGYATPPDALPPLDEQIEAGNGWKIIESDFVFVWVLQTSHASASMHSGPGLVTDDGLFNIYFAETISRCDILQLLLVFDTGGHVGHPKLPCYKTTAYRLEPFDTQGIFSLDGEVVEYGPIQGLMKPSCARSLKLKK